MPDAAKTNVILPGATLGVFGGGQLGRMFAQAAMRMGYRVIVFSPEANSPAGQVAHEEIVAPYEDDLAVERFARQCDAVTLEFENVPVAAAEIAAHHTVLRPGAAVLGIAQDRLAERAFLDRFAFPTAAHRAVRSADDLHRAVATLGTPCVVKSARLGYDGRGQVRLNDASEVESAWRALDVDEALCEAWVSYYCELSVLVARSSNGAVEAFGPMENRHSRHILDVSTVPAAVAPNVQREAIELACAVAERLELEGLICVEMFHTADGGLVINELAPRPHNSGHLTIEACAVSQFEQQVRAVCNLPLAAMTLRQPAAMANLLGEVWAHGEPDWARALAVPDVSLHLYGKSSPRTGRKMGHLTAVAETVEAAHRRVVEARKLLAPMSTPPTDRRATKELLSAAGCN